jgi:hypothetical protein
MSDRKPEYKTTVQDEHWRQEEFQWARVLSTGHAAKGMVLLYLQKACTAFHEFEPAFATEALDDNRVGFFRDRLAGRLRQLLTTMENNKLGRINGAEQLREILRAVESAETLGALAELTEELHQTGHVLLDALEES